MRTVTATELARNFRQILDSIQLNGEEVVIERNHHQVARLLPGPGSQTALQAMADLYRTLPPKAATGWIDEARAEVGKDSLDENMGDPWAS